MARRDNQRDGDVQTSGPTPVKLPAERYFKVTLRDGWAREVTAHGHAIMDPGNGVVAFTRYELVPDDPEALLPRVIRILWNVVDVEEVYQGETQGGVM